MGALELGQEGWGWCHPGPPSLTRAPLPNSQSPPSGGVDLHTSPCSAMLAGRATGGTCWYNPALNGCPQPVLARSFIAVGMFVTSATCSSTPRRRTNQFLPLHATPGSRKRATSAPQTCAQENALEDKAHTGFKQPRLIASTA